MLNPCKYINSDVLTGIKLLFDIALPGLKMVNPPLNRIEVNSNLINDKLPSPPVILDKHHLNFFPLSLPTLFVKEPGRNRVVAVGEYAGLTKTLSPTTLFMGKRPQSISGFTLSITTLFLPSLCGIKTSIP